MATKCLHLRWPSHPLCHGCKKPCKDYKTHYIYFCDGQARDSDDASSGFCNKCIWLVYYNALVPAWLCGDITMFIESKWCRGNVMLHIIYLSFILIKAPFRLL